MRIVAISDIHERWHNIAIPECDLLISAGDYSFHGSPNIVKLYHEWLDQQPATHIISVQGNHETWVEKNFGEAKKIALEACPHVHFIDEGLVEIDGIKIYCSAITPMFFNWAWNRARGEEIKAHWDMIPMDTNILISHGPPYGILDIVPWVDGTPKERVGCQDLLDAVKRIKPDLHIFGHIHHSHGEHHEDGTSFYNVSIYDERYAPSNGVTVIDYELE
jgi:Icc-related predicted phosphoesterase